MATYTRIHKAKARKMMSQGFEILATPRKVNPAYFGGLGVVMDKYITPDFDKTCAQLVYYGCNHETGYYLAFYLVTDK